MKEIQLSNGKVAIVDDGDYEALRGYKWTFGQGYARRYEPIQKRVLLHRQIMNPPPGMQVDHINGDKLDNRRENLRICDFAQNMRNRPKVKGDHSSHYKGVTWSKKLKKWQSGIGYLGKYYFLGFFENEKDAALAFNKRAKEFHGEFACLNQI
jgi:hypothetical protein